jgi:hypothetical protein
MQPGLATYPGCRFPAEIISHAIWLYIVFSLSLTCAPELDPGLMKELGS